MLCEIWIALSRISAQSVRAAEYMITSLQRGKNPTNNCPGFDTKPSDDEVPVLELWGNVEYSFNAITPKTTLAWMGSLCVKLNYLIIFCTLNHSILWNYLIVCKGIMLNRIISVSSTWNQFIVMNRTIGVRLQYLKSFNRVQTNDFLLI